MNALKTGGIENIKNFDQLFPFLRNELDWPIEEADFEIDDLTFEYDAAKDLGLKEDDITHIREIRQLRPLETDQPWGIFFVNFEDRNIPVGVLKRVLGGLTLKKRQSSNKAEQKGWSLHDLLFISASGDTGERELSFLHFTEENGGKNKIVLKELGWDKRDTKTKQAYVYNALKEHLSWPDDANGFGDWSDAFTVGHGEVIATSKILTKRLAELASRIREAAGEILAAESKNGPLTKIFDDFKKTIFHNLTPADFADMYAQTICYGLLVVQIDRQKQGLDTKTLSADDAALHTSSVIHPFLQELMESFLAVGGRKSKMDFNELGVNEVVELLQQANMKAVVLDFGNKNPNEDPILHFYEHFLKDYDSLMRKNRGVYYTPLPVVGFIVRSVDEILQKEFGLEDGLADTATWGDMHKRNPEIKIPEGVNGNAPFVQILDPATGTGTFLVETIGLIERRMKDKWRKAGKNESNIDTLWNDYVPQHLLPRLNGFELMMAPYAIAHIKIGLKLTETGYQPKENNGPRVQVYLTNTLDEPINTGQTGTQASLSLITDSLALEAKGADEIKANTSITVVIGNPPYSRHSHNKGRWLNDLLRDYKKEPKSDIALQERNSKWLNDDYVKFTRYGQNLIQHSNYGIVSLITNHGFLDNPTFRGMRWSLFDSFNEGYFVNLHGSSNFDDLDSHEKDENVFDIKQGVSINILVRNSKKNKCKVSYKSIIGNRKLKYDFLLRNSLLNIGFNTVDPKPKYFHFVPRENDNIEVYNSWLGLDEMFISYSTGYYTSCDEVVLADNSDDLCSQITHQAVDKSKIKDTCYRPFDIKKIYYDTKLITRARHKFIEKVGTENTFLISGKSTKSHYISHFYITKFFSELKLGEASKGSYMFPLNLKSGDILKNESVNFQQKTIEDFEPFTKQYIDIVYYIYAVLHSNRYRVKYYELLKDDFPRIPLPDSVDLFRGLVLHGSQLVSLHTLDEKEVNALDKPDTRFVCKGEARVESGYPPKECKNGKVMINPSCHFEDVTPDVWDFNIGGYQVCYKWLKDRAGKGGKNPHPGRILSEDDILHYRRITIAIRETIALMKQVDDTINEHGGWPGAFYQAPPAPPSVEEIIQADESLEVEYKSTFQWDVKEKKKNTELQKSSLKTVTAFLNSAGGTLVIGVTDDKQIFGLDQDIKLTRNSLDWFEQTFRNILDNAIGVDFAPFCNVRFSKTSDGKHVCVVEIKESKEPVFLKFQGKEEFFIRRGNATKSLTAKEQHDYIRKRFS